ncbi:MAG: acetate--CoA ligase family protein, partial [Desulfobacteraceae bacterium]
MANIDHQKNDSVNLAIDFDAITQLFKQADQQGRDYLFEYETYALLQRSGAETPPRTNLLVKGSRPSDEQLTAMPGDKVVLKIVSPAIIHKTEVGGVKVVDKSPEKIRSAWRRMMYEVPETYAAMIERNPAHAAEVYRGLSGEQLQQAIARDIRG